jgi:NRPS condensation-like uncharacterized protein
MIYLHPPLDGLFIYPELFEMCMSTREASSLDLFCDSIRLLGDATLCAVMEFDRELHPGVLEEAARACLRAHPVLHSRLVRGNGPAFWELVEPASLPVIVIEECPEYYHPFVAGPVDPYGPVQCRVRLLRRPSGDVIVLNLAHAAADGFGLHTLMAQLIQEYREPGSICPSVGRIPERDTLWTRDLIRENTPPPPATAAINSLWPDPFGTSSAPSSYHRECISTATLGAIRTRVKGMGGNLNDLVMAAYFLAMSDLTGHPGPIDIFFPVNLRQHLDDGSRVMSNQAANVSFMLERQDGEGMIEILPRIIAATRALKAPGIGIAEQVLLDKTSDPEGKHVHQMAEELLMRQRTGLADIFISNPGPITLPDIEGLSDAYICYPGVSMPATCFVISTFCGKMTITLGFQDSEKAREGTRKAMDLFRHHLVSWFERS